MNNKYQLAGWLAIAWAIIIVPATVLDLIVQSTVYSNPVFNILVAFFTIILATLGVYVLYMFRNLLNERHNFHETDTLITLLIGFEIIIHAIKFFVNLIPSITGSTTTILAILVVPWGIIHIIFAIQLLKLSDNLSGLLKPYVFVNMGGGILMVTVILLPFSLPFFIAGSIMLGIIFFRSNEEVEFV